jgi:hypothetical protein
MKHVSHEIKTSLSVALAQLECEETDDENLFKNAITDEEIWAYHYEPKSKYKSSQPKYLLCPQMRTSNVQ